MIGEDETGVLQPLLVEELCWGCAGISSASSAPGFPGRPDRQRHPGPGDPLDPELFGTPAEPKVGAFAVTERGQGRTSPASAPGPSATATTGYRRP